jgi:phosphatidylinositol N-acetylglucosaminyltransferase subunit P
VIYILWSFLPSPILHQLGISYYLNRWWALAIPSYLVMTIVYVYVALAAYNTNHLTLPMASIENLVDEAANVAVLDANGRILRTRGKGTCGEGRVWKREGPGAGIDWRAAWSVGTDAVMDVPVSFHVFLSPERADRVCQIGGVNEILYGGG